MNAPVYAVGDIHGHLGELDRVLGLIGRDGGPGAEIVFLGDLVDRGPDSRGVVERIARGVAQGRPWRVLMGNHDRMFVRFLREGAVHDPRILSGAAWTHPRLGGLDTLASYGVREPEADIALLHAAALAAVPEAHAAFLECLPLSLERDGLLFVHAGIAPGVPLHRQDPEDLIWIRGPFLDHPDPHPWLVVHGHTALERPQHFGNRIDLDGGAGYGRPLRAAAFDGRGCWLLTERGREPLRA